MLNKKIKTIDIQSSTSRKTVLKAKDKWTVLKSILKHTKQKKL